MKTKPFKILGLLFFSLLISSAAIKAQPSKYKIVNLNEEKYQDIKFNDIIKKYKGKVIYIDFWASYCKPCIEEFPFIKNLQKKYSHQKLNIIFVSFDRNAYQWEQTIKDLQVYGNHYLVNSKLVSEIKEQLKLSSIPRYVLINKRGKIVNTDAKEPSNPKLIKEIDAML